MHRWTGACEARHARCRSHRTTLRRPRELRRTDGFLHDAIEDDQVIRVESSVCVPYDRQPVARRKHPRLRTDTVPINGDSGGTDDPSRRQRPHR